METMTAVTVSCPSCARPMSFNNNSWQCLACHPIPADIPTCKTQVCKRPLTKLGEPWNCWICLKCNKHPEEVRKMRKEDDERKRKYVGKTVSVEEFDKLKQQMAELLAKPAYPPTQAEIQTIVAPETINAAPDIRRLEIGVIKPETYLQKAKRLGVKTHDTGEGGTGGMRKKAEIMADMESIEQGMITLPDKTEESDEESNAFREKAQSPPSDDDDYARGLTASDMMNG